MPVKSPFVILSIRHMTDPSFGEKKVFIQPLVARLLSTLAARDPQQSGLRPQDESKMFHVEHFCKITFLAPTL